MIVDFGRHELYLQLTDNYIDGIHAVQGETSRQIKFVLVDAVGMVRDATGLKLIMTVALKGGIDQMEAMGNSQGEFIITLTPGMLSRYGKADYQLILTENDEVLASVIGKLHIERNIAYDSGDGINILLDFAELKQVMDLAKTINSQVEMTLNQTVAEREKAEECSTESCRCAKESQENLTASRQIKTDLADVFETENARKQAEELRSQAELERKEAESLRSSTETQRKQSELERKNAEEERENTELQRETSESEREQAEQSRGLAEDDRQLKENERQSAEIQRKLDEDARLEQEVSRELAESKRVQAEDSRVQTWSSWENLIEENILPKATSQTAGVIKIDQGDTAVSVETYQADLDNKVDKVTGKELSDNNYTDADKEKLAGVEEGATKYVHPETHPASIIEESETKRFVTDVEKEKWNGKVDKISGKGLSTNDYTTEEKDKLEQLYQIAIISSGESTASIPNGTIILELE